MLGGRFAITHTPLRDRVRMWGCMSQGCDVESRSINSVGERSRWWSVVSFLGAEYVSLLLRSAIESAMHNLEHSTEGAEVECSVGRAMFSEQNNRVASWTRGRLH